MAREEGRYITGAMSDQRFNTDGLAEYFKKIVSSGVLELGDNLKVVVGTGLQITINYGTAIVDGYPYKVINNNSGLLTLTVAAGNTLPRIDRVVICKDLTAQRVYAYIKKGTPAASPSPPALDTTTNYEISICKIAVGANASLITASNLTDERNKIINSLNVNPNLIINGNFDIWQRGISQTMSGYGSVDRWSCYHFGSTKSHSRQTFAIGQTDVPGNPTYFSRTVVSSVAGSQNCVLIAQLIENVTRIAGEKVTISFWAKADANKNIAIEVVQSFGSGGSSTVTGIGQQLIPITTVWSKYVVTIAIPSIAGKTLGTNGKKDTSTAVYFWFDSGSAYNGRAASLGQQSGTFDIAQVKLEEGGSVTPFVPKIFAEELRDCQRYYEKSYNYEDAPGTNTSTGLVIFCGASSLDKNHYGQIPYRVSKRIAATPKFYTYSGTADKWTYANNYSSGDAAILPCYVGENGTGVYVGTGYAWTPGYIQGHWIAEAEI